MFIKSPKEIEAAEKGTAKYDEIMHMLKSENYRHQMEESESDGCEDIGHERTLADGEGDDGFQLQLDEDGIK